MSIKIFFKAEAEAAFWQNWGKLTRAKQCGPEYLPVNLRSYLSVSAFKSLLVKDRSFVYLVNNEPVGGAFLPIEKNGTRRQASLGLGFIYAPLFTELSFGKQIYSLLDELAQTERLAKVMLAASPFDDIAQLSGSAQSYNYFMRFGYLDCSILTYVIDLTVTDLFKACRRGHQADLKKIKQDPDFKVFYIDQKNPDRRLHEEYVQLHHKCSGRITRPPESFDFQFVNLQNSSAVLFGLKYKEQNVAYSYFEYSAGQAAYTSGADDPDFTHLHLYHPLVFSAMEYLKKIGVKYLHVGQPACPSSQLSYYPDNKQLNIALFKRGFGGQYWNNYRGIKYFSEAAFLSDQAEFVENYKKFLPNNLKHDEKTNKN